MSWSASIEDLRERLLDPAELAATVNQPAGIAVSLGLSLVGDAYPEFPDTHPAWGPRLAGALGFRSRRSGSRRTGAPSAATGGSSRVQRRRGRLGDRADRRCRAGVHRLPVPAQGDGDGAEPLR